jgi:hypothetical protein
VSETQQDQRTMLSMANHSDFGRHVQGARIDNVLHACPDCGIGAARIECRYCEGAGTVTPLQLHLWIKQRNEEQAP